MCEGVRVFCRHGKPHAFNEHELNLANLSTRIGVVHVKHFDNEQIQVLAVDYAHLKDKPDLDNLFNDGEFIAYRHSVSVIDTHTAHEISASIQLLLWQKANQFCGYCGTKNTPMTKIPPWLALPVISIFIPKFSLVLLLPSPVLAPTQATPKFS